VFTIPDNTVPDVFAPVTEIALPTKFDENFSVVICKRFELTVMSAVESVIVLPATKFAGNSKVTANFLLLPSPVYTTLGELFETAIFDIILLLNYLPPLI
jgi:hypothetical protein